jgi:hypothetical protein
LVSEEARAADGIEAKQAAEHDGATDEESVNSRREDCLPERKVLHEKELGQLTRNDLKKEQKQKTKRKKKEESKMIQTAQQQQRNQ